jgi:polar amino acid transport system permease protein
MGMIGGGESLAARSINQQLAGDIVASRRRRSRRWRLQFTTMWVAIIVALIAGLLLTVGINSDFIQKWTPFILLGVPVTIFVALVSIFFAVLLAVLGAVGRMSRNPYVNAVASFYVSFFRGTPLILQILFVFLALPQAGIVLDPLPTAIVALSLNYGAYLTEIFRSGIEAVPHGQTEAAESLGMSERLAFRRIIVPQAFRIVTPAIGNDFIAMLKDSALASTVGVQELLWRAQTAGRPSFQSMQTLFVAALVYWTLTISFSFFQNRLERRMATGDRQRLDRHA